MNNNVYFQIHQIAKTTYFMRILITFYSIFSHYSIRHFFSQPLPKMYINLYTPALTVRRTHSPYVPIRPKKPFGIPCLSHRNHKTSVKMFTPH